MLVQAFIMPPYADTGFHTDTGEPAAAHNRT